MIGLFQKINIMKNSITKEDLYIMVNYVHIPKSRRERKRRHALGMHNLPSLIKFLRKGIQRYPSSPTIINAMSIR